MKTEGRWFVDNEGFYRIYRGVNLGGSTKMPYQPNGATWNREGFYQPRGVSFAGRPFPLEDADYHLGKLRHWGFNLLRLLTTWEAVEHDGPGIYDEEYLNYLREIGRKAADYGFDFFIDPHQDVWSRWTGGDGAPAWTMELLGMDITKLSDSGAAVLHQEWGDPFPRMIWPLNYNRYGAATMLTLFFGGNDFAPQTSIQGQPVQDFLQDHFIKAMTRVAEVLKDNPRLIGFGTSNEPHHGFIGSPDLRRQSSHILYGICPTPWQSIQAAAGIPQKAPRYHLGLAGSRRLPEGSLNPEGVSLFREGFQEIWEQNGVWSRVSGVPELDRPLWFTQQDCRPIHFGNQYLVPFLRRYSEAIHRTVPRALIFIEGVPSGLGSDQFSWSEDPKIPSVHALHWYDGPALFLKRFSPRLSFDPARGKPILGRKNVQNSFSRQIGELLIHTEENMDNIPPLLGEFGIPYDLNHKKSFRTGRFRKQTQALEMYYNALDAHLLSSTQWNYTADNTNRRGDNWNDEDLSIYSLDQDTAPENPDSGGRAVDGFCRPYTRRCPGKPLIQEYSRRRGRFSFTFRPDRDGTVEIFVPDRRFSSDYLVKISGGTLQRKSEEQLLLWTVEGFGEKGDSEEAWIEIRSSSGASGGSP